ncbi:MAG: hypothetical protein DRN24_05235, partial [Thermoplasmata archaeon]
MIRKKIFGIGAAALLLLIAFTPIVNSIQKNSTYLTNNDECDLKIEILNGPYLIDREPVIRDGTLCTKWGITYRITNEYNKRIISKPSVKVRTTDGTERVIDSWYVDINLEPKQAVDYTHTFYAEISEDIDVDEERYVADHQIKLVCGGGGFDDVNPLNNFDIKRVIKFWKGNKFYGPTQSQILACLPWRYEEKTISIDGKDISYPEITKLYEKDNRLAGFRCKGRTIQDVINSNEFKNLKNWANNQIWDGWEDFKDLLDKFIEKFEDVMDLFWEDLPNELNNHRFGWTKNVTRYVISISVDTILFLLTGGACIYTIVNSPEFIFILGWIRKACTLFDKLFSGEEIAKLLGEVLGIDVLCKLITYATGLLTLIEICGGIE